MKIPAGDIIWLAQLLLAHQQLSHLIYSLPFPLNPLKPYTIFIISVYYLHKIHFIQTFSCMYITYFDQSPLHHYPYLLPDFFQRNLRCCITPVRRGKKKIPTVCNDLDQELHFLINSQRYGSLCKVLVVQNAFCASIKT